MMLNLLFLLTAFQAHASNYCHVSWHEGKIPMNGCNCLTAVSSAGISIVGDAKDSKTSKCLSKKYCNKKNVCGGFLKEKIISINDLNPDEMIEN